MIGQPRHFVQRVAHIQHRNLQLGMQTLQIRQYLLLAGAVQRESGSSINSRRGLVSSARPIATRCFSPPDKLAVSLRLNKDCSPNHATTCSGCNLRNPGRCAASHIPDCHAPTDAGTNSLPETRSQWPPMRWTKSSPSCQVSPCTCRSPFGAFSSRRCNAARWSCRSRKDRTRQ